MNSTNNLSKVCQTSTAVGRNRWSKVSNGLLALAGTMLLWLAQPPLAAAWLAWVALIPWAMLIGTPLSPGRSGYRWLWLAGTLWWLMTMQGVRLAHPALYPGWIVLGVYLGVYVPLFVGLARVMVHQWRWPVWAAVPITWSGLELVRSYAFTGFSAVLLGHSQVDWPVLIQIADLGGSYLVSFLVALVNGVLCQVFLALWCRRQQKSFQVAATSQPNQSSFSIPLFGLGVTIASLLGTVSYGLWRLQQADDLARQEPLLKAVLLQRDEPLVYSMDPVQEANVFRRYIESAMQAASAVPDADVFVWPESMFTGGLPYRILGDNWQVPTMFEMGREDFQQGILDQQQYFQQRTTAVQRSLTAAAQRETPAALLVGCAVYRYGERPQAFGGAILIGEAGEVESWYGKRHLVMFGEYIPFGEQFPFLYEIGPLRQGATPGDGPLAMKIGSTTLMPSICFETMVEHVTGNGLRTLTQNDQPVDVITNITNDAWFHGSAILSHHRRCTQMVALINRRPVLMAANQGPTSWIDGAGRIQKKLDYLVNANLVTTPTADGRWSLYQQWGDFICWPLAGICAVAAVSGWRKRRAARQPA